MRLVVAWAADTSGAGEASTAVCTIGGGGVCTGAFLHSSTSSIAETAAGLSVHGAEQLGDTMGERSSERERVAAGRHDGREKQ